MVLGVWGFGDFQFWGLGLDNNVLAEDGGLLQVLSLQDFSVSHSLLLVFLGLGT